LRSLSYTNLSFYIPPSLLFFRSIAALLEQRIQRSLVKNGHALVFYPYPQGRQLLHRSLPSPHQRLTPQPGPRVWNRRHARHGVLAMQPILLLLRPRLWLLRLRLLLLLL
jgi:hypothetical protein